MGGFRDLFFALAGGVVVKGAGGATMDDIAPET